MCEAAIGVSNRVVDYPCETRGDDVQDEFKTGFPPNPGTSAGRGPGAGQ